jgi:flagellar biosynthesis protein FlhB
MKAYPYMHKHPTSGQTTISDGMDLRDWFAGQALEGLLASEVIDNMDTFVTRSYLLADLMMKQREVKNEQP